jgi:hypothetical protein
VREDERELAVYLRIEEQELARSAGSGGATPLLQGLYPWFSVARLMTNTSPAPSMAHPFGRPSFEGNLA